MFGDSINRAIVSEYCGRINGVAQDWAIGNFSYKEGAAASVTCQAASLNLRFSFLNIYGSRRVGPYANNHTNTASDPYADTQLRLKHSIEIYSTMYGKPDLVFFRCDLWDMHAHAICPTAGHKHKTLSDRVWYLKGCGQAPEVDMNRIGVPTSEADRAKIVAEFIQETRWCLRYLRALLPESTIAMHTIPPPSWGLELFFELDNSIRYVCAVEDVVLFDFQLMFLSKPMLSYLRDVHHPNTEVTTWIGDSIFHAWRTWRVEMKCI